MRSLPRAWKLPAWGLLLPPTTLLLLSPAVSCHTRSLEGWKPVHPLSLFSTKPHHSLQNQLQLKSLRHLQTPQTVITVQEIIQRLHFQNQTQSILPKWYYSIHLQKTLFPMKDTPWNWKTETVSLTVQISMYRYKKQRNRKKQGTNKTSKKTQ